MFAHDSNDATWYVLRYAEDFATLTGSPHTPAAPFTVPSSPYLESTLLFDAQRGVLELQPEASPFAADPPQPICLDIDGEIYLVDDTGTLVVIRCDGSSVPLPCESKILAQPAGLALDRRGYLYVADPAAARVVVLNPDHANVVAILGGGGPIGPLIEPIDVAISPAGLIYVADRTAGIVAVFSSGMKPLRSFPTAAAEGKEAQPIAVMIDPDGNLLVADAWLPRLQSYSPDGTRLADADLPTLLAPLAGGALAMGAFDRAYGDEKPHFLVGTCGPCATPEDDGAARLAEVHRALRLLGLTLGQRFAQQGIFISRTLDGGRPGILWHRVEVEWNTPPPASTKVLIETFTADTPTPGAPAWTAPLDASGNAISFSTEVPEQLVQSSPGRYMWIRVTLHGGDQKATPSISAIRAWYPRLSWLDLLPAAYRRDPAAATFLDHFLALFEHIFTGTEDAYVRFSHELNLDAAPLEVIDWLGALVDLAFDPSWPVQRRRALVGEAISLYRTRGTIAGIERYVEIYTGRRPEIVEAWLERPSSPSILGRPGAHLGGGLALLDSSAAGVMLPDDQLWARYAHRFTIYVYIDDRCDTTVALRAVDRILEVNKPAHTVHTSQAVFPDARVGVQSRVGLDFVLGSATPAFTRAGDPREQPSPSILGRDSILGERRPQYIRRLDTGEAFGPLGTL
jgi:phage tail-like protein